VLDWGENRRGSDWTAQRRCGVILMRRILNAGFGLGIRFGFSGIGVGFFDYGVGGI